MNGWRLHLDTPGLLFESPQVLAPPPLQPAAMKTSKVASARCHSSFLLMGPPSPLGQEAGHPLHHTRSHALRLSNE